MKLGASAALLRETLFVAGPVAGLDDEQLLARFSAGLGVVSELAFQALVGRHGPMVLATCRRALGDFHQADDAFQATFLVLARRARTVRGQSLGPWLHGVARKVCRKARNTRDRLEHREARPLSRPNSTIDPTDLAHQSELRDLIDRELARMPGKLRSAIVLCDLQGLSHDDAARQLGCPVGTVKSRQARGRARLRDRLAKLGLDPAAVATPAAIVPARLALTTASAAVSFPQGGLIAAGVGPSAIALSLSTLKELSMIHLFKTAAAAVAGLGSLAVAVAVQEPASSTTPAPAAALPPQAEAAATPRQGSAVPAIGTVPLPTPASTAVPVLAPATVSDPQSVRLQSLEQKLDRVLTALERSLPDGRPPHDPFPEPGGSDAIPRGAWGVGIRSASPTTPLPAHARVQPTTPSFRPSIEARLSALEQRLNVVEDLNSERLQQLEDLVEQLRSQVQDGEPPGSASRRPRVRSNEPTRSAAPRTTPRRAAPSEDQDPSMPGDSVPTARRPSSISFDR